MTFVLSKLQAYLAMAVAAFLAVALASTGFLLVKEKLAHSKTLNALTTEQRDRAKENQERMRIALDDARATFRKGEIHARNQQEIADAHAVQEKRRQARIAAVVADGQRLRQQVAQFAAACGGGEADSPATAIQHCRDRAATLGVLYGEADEQAEAFAGAAEQHADEVRTLMRVIENDRSLLSPPGGLGIKPPRWPDAGTTESKP